ncbi:Alpha/beta hydrolase family protein [Planctomycetes bacterium CA13]|uniref:Alpha/beta hydrolase family protein n=1 Tax=Novipirellula herctigrandis TaxID=2527986 RepID=A0A5C5YMT2_9BACT|nr:Alpha/beta hydrolase family protein [Planctomycetes bacterium CA13]
MTQSLSPGRESDREPISMGNGGCSAPSTIPTAWEKVFQKPVLLAVFAGIFAITTSAGCTSPRYLSNRSVRENPLNRTLKLVGVKGPQVSQRTWNTLTRFGLDNQYSSDHHKCFTQIRQTINSNPDPELVYALSELSYVEGKKSERTGDLLNALSHYGVALTNSYDYLFSEDLNMTRNAFDPQFRAASDLYNESLEDTLRILCSEHHIEPGRTYTIKTPDREFIVRTEMHGKWKPEEFDRYEFVSDYDIETLHNRHTTYGLGVPLIAVRKSALNKDPRERFYPDGLSYAVSAMMRCAPNHKQGRAGESPTCVLEFFDPLQANQVEIANQWVPLETDLTTPLAFFLDSPEFRKRNQATEGLLDPDESQQRRGIYMLEPYDPDRIPVLMVHGLWSSPLTWMDMFNDLRSFPEIRERYQFWFYLYPSGQPFWISAAQLRSDLLATRNAFDAGHRDRAIDQMVLVGHSMGGLVSRLQTMESGDDFWKIVSDKPAEKLRGADQDRVKLVSTLYFKPNQSIRRVITIGTPHRGSDFANDYTRWLARKFIKLPQLFVSTGKRLARENPNFFRDTKLLTTANAIDSLAPKSPIFPVMLRAKHSPDIKFHNIVGVVDKRGIFSASTRRGDGIVEFESAHMDDVESELIVDSEHTTMHMTGKAIFEVRRVLLEHLQQIDSEDRVAIRPIQISDQH